MKKRNNFYDLSAVLFIDYFLSKQLFPQYLKAISHRLDVWYQWKIKRLNFIIPCFIQSRNVFTVVFDINVLPVYSLVLSYFYAIINLLFIFLQKICRNFSNFRYRILSWMQANKLSWRILKPSFFFSPAIYLQVFTNLFLNNNTFTFQKVFGALDVLFERQSICSTFYRHCLEKEMHCTQFQIVTVMLYLFYCLYIFWLY